MNAAKMLRNTANPLTPSIRFIDTEYRGRRSIINDIESLKRDRFWYKQECNTP